MIGFHLDIFSGLIRFFINDGDEPPRTRLASDPPLSPIACREIRIPSGGLSAIQLRAAIAHNQYLNNITDRSTRDNYDRTRTGQHYDPYREHLPDYQEVPLLWSRSLLSGTDVQRRGRHHQNENGVLQRRIQRGRRRTGNHHRTRQQQKHPLHFRQRHWHDR